MVGLLLTISSFPYTFLFSFWGVLNIVVGAHLTAHLTILMLSFHKILRVLACGQSCGHVVSLVVMWSVLWLCGQSCGHVVSLVVMWSVFIQDQYFPYCVFAKFVVVGAHLTVLMLSFRKTDCSGFPLWSVFYS